jgi:aspartate kinase
MTPGAKKKQKIVSLKFGGTSMGSAAAIQECAKIVDQTAQTHLCVVTVSAVSGVTNALLDMIDLAKRQKPRLVAKRLGQLEQQHRQILAHFFPEPQKAEAVWQEDFQPILDKLRAILHGTSLVGDLTHKMQAKVCSFGESLSSFFLVYALDQLGRPPHRVLSEKIIRTDSRYLEAELNLKTTAQACRKILLPLLKQGMVPIVTGFIGKDTHGDTTLLGRGGSDYTASILAVVLKASQVQIWTDVDGVMSADPRLVGKTVSWSKMGMKMMSEMAYSGAKVVHPRSLSLAVSKNIPVYIRNTFNRSFQGTQIVSQEVKNVKGIVTSDDNILLHIDNPNMLEEVGFIARVTEIVESFGVAIDVCCTSETSFTFSVLAKDFHTRMEKALQKIGQVRRIDHVAKLSLIGHDITQDPKIFEDIFRMCNQKNATIASISVGASKRNITLMLDQKSKVPMLQSLHQTWIQAQGPNS